MSKTLLSSTEISVLSEVTDVQRSITSTVCLQFSHLLSTHPYFLSKWFIMEYIRKSLIWLNSGIKHYKCNPFELCFVSYIQTKKC